MATPKHAPALSFLEQLKLSKPLPPPLANDVVNDVIAALKRGDKLNEKTTALLIEALGYFQIILLDNARSRRRGRPTNNSKRASALIIRDLVADEGMTVKAAAVRVMGKDAPPNVVTNVKRMYHKFMKENPRKAK